MDNNNNNNNNNNNGFPSIKEPHGLLRSDIKRPGGLTLSPWRDGRCVTRDVTVTLHVTPSYRSISFIPACAASAAEAAAKRKEKKHTDIACKYHFFSIAFETFGSINQVGADFISALGHRDLSNTDDSRETFFPFQRLL